MLYGLGKESLGWLLIDEAGQALPQASVGAIARCKRAVVVGDPLQIEPIVTLPEVLTAKICEQFQIDANIFNAPVASTQTLADLATKYIGVFETNVDSREVGVPLLVHRRCSEPMFSVSNAVAYENLMVQAKHPRSSSLIKALGPSRWIDVKGTGTTKWCREEGEEAMRLLQQAKDAGCPADIYLVTPFVDVQNNMRSLVEQSHILDGWVEDPDSWVYERIGTVHTVQGREAEGVVFILGAPNSDQNGARVWAGKSPNLLNVAVTRAKEVLYVIGNRDHWQRAGVFNTLSQKLK
jgi:superfamily I DNA and/or RNA helicase